MVGLPAFLALWTLKSKLKAPGELNSAISLEAKEEC